MPYTITDYRDDLRDADHATCGVCDKDVPARLVEDIDETAWCGTCRESRCPQCWERFTNDGPCDCTPEEETA